MTETEDNSSRELSEESGSGDLDKKNSRMGYMSLVIKNIDEVPLLNSASRQKMRDAGWIVEVLGIGPVAWIGIGIAVAMPSANAFLWAGIALPALMGTAGYMVEKWAESGRETKMLPPEIDSG